MGDDEASSKTVVLKIFGPELGEKLALAAGYGKRKDYRGVLEPTDPTTQCERSGHPFVAGMKCYICDQPIPAKETLSGSDDELYPECEHVFSMTEARWFLDIYMARNPPKDPWTKRAVELEYEYAHRVCNQAKSNANFFVTGEDGNPTISAVAIRKILINIRARAQKAISNYSGRPSHRAIMEQIASGVLARFEDVRARAQQCIDHVVSGPGGNPDYKNLFLLSRAAVLSDPTVLSPTLQSIYTEWYENKPAAMAKKYEVIQHLITNTYLAYPQLQPASLYTILLGGIPEIPPTIILPQALVENTLRMYFDKIPTDSSTEKKLLSSVYYEVYRTLLNDILTTNPFSPSLPCTLYGRLKVIAENEPDVVNLFGPPPEIPASLGTQCEILIRNQEREYRTQARELNLLPQEDEPITAEEDAAYFLDGVRPLLESNLAKLGISAARETTEVLMNRIRQAFLDTYPNGVEAAKEAAANEADEILRIGLLNTFGPKITDDFATGVYTFIVNSRIDETRTYGGSLRNRRPLYTKKNTHASESSETVHESSGDARLRKRSRPRHTPRIRQPSHKSRTRRNRKYLDRL